jgi:thioredoxin 1
MKIIKFSAEWCGPCKMLDKQLPQVIEHFESKGIVLEIEKVDIDLDKEKANQYDIMGVPTLILEPSQKRLVGYMPAAKLIEELEAQN